MSGLFAHKEPWIWLAGVVVFLSAYALLTVWLVNKAKNRQGQLVSLYMALKIVKLLLFVSVLLAYRLMINIETVRFTIITIVLYLIYLLMDTFFLTYKERKWKEK
ncbi:hypothetical protein AGMMS50262_06920 [Bacteroidia bacterium]|nr:hypothetical protein AGMMS50262_06920 [Bacteroidia bacterium]